MASWAVLNVISPRVSLRCSAPHRPHQASRRPPGSGEGPARQNPLLNPSALAFHAPAFDKIRDGDFKPAIERGIQQQRAEIERIANDTAAPTFDNTIVALERTGQLLNRAYMVFNGLAGANTNDTLQKVQEEEAPKLAALQDAMYLNDRLFARVEAVYGQRDQLKLSPEGRRLVEWYHQHFILAGAKLSAADKAALKKLNEEDATLSAKFTTHLLEAAKNGALVVSDKSALAGLTDAQIAAAAQAAKARALEGKWVLPLQNTTEQPDLVSLTSRDTRHKLFDASWTRAERGDASDTRDIIARQAQIRAQQAALVGYPDFAAWKLQDQMAKNSGRGEPLPRTARAARHGARARRGRRSAEADRRPARRFHAGAVGLELLRRTGAQGEVQPERIGDQAVLRAQSCTEGRRVLRGEQAVRPHVHGAPPTCPCTRRT
jgi:Zn-dependent oligopeptidases